MFNKTEYDKKFLKENYAKVKITGLTKEQVLALKERASENNSSVTSYLLKRAAEYDSINDGLIIFKSSKPGTESIGITITKKQKDELYNKAKICGYKTLTGFIRMLIDKDEEIIDKNKEMMEIFKKFGYS